MAKSFKKANPLEQLEDNKPVTDQKPIETPVAVVEPKRPNTTKTAIPDKPKRKPGRPKVKTEECKTVNIAIPVSVLEQMEIAKMKYGDNLTRYINEIIAKDLDENMEMYQNIYNMLKQ